MRAWPIGLVFENEERVIALAMAQSRITHRHPMAQAACAALAIGIMLAVENKHWYESKKGSKDGFVDAMIDVAHKMRNAAEDVYKAQEAYKIDKAHRQEVEYKHGVMAREDVRKQVRATNLPQNKVLIEDMLSYAVHAALAGDTPKDVLGEINDKGDKSVAERSRSGTLLGWAADEALAAALYIFVRYTDQQQLALRKAEFKQMGRLWDDKNIIWYALQEGAATPGDSDSIASLTGALMGAYHSTQIPESEKRFLVDHLESFQDFVKDAHWVVTSQATKTTAPLQPIVVVKPSLSSADLWQNLLGS